MQTDDQQPKEAAGVPLLFRSAREALGVTQKNAEQLAQRLGTESVHALVHMLPRRLRRRQLISALSLALDHEEVFVRVESIATVSPRRRGSPWQVRVRLIDNPQDTITLLWFIANGNWILDRFAVGTSHLIGGKLENTGDDWRIAHPDNILPPDSPISDNSVEIVYTRIGTLDSKKLAILAGRALQLLHKFMPTHTIQAEWQIPEFLHLHQLPSLLEAFDQLHHPESEAVLTPDSRAMMRLACDEYFSYQIALRILKDRHDQHAGKASQGDGILRAKLETSLPFALTGTQARAIAEISADLAAQKRMIRLLQGDVGSGKTVVALMTILQVVEAGGQAAFMAPTEILARQHFATLSRMLFPLGVVVELLTGSVKGKARKGTLGKLVNGSISILVGTHALFSEEVTYRDLRYVVIDEQHRFGVRQRMEITNKGAEVDVLLMSATPIPRSYIQVLYGEMPTSRLTEKPPGRKPIVTRILSDAGIGALCAGLHRQIGRGEQVFWVCPAIEENTQLTAAEVRYDDLVSRFDPGVVGIVHGRMTSKERHAAMQRFAEGKVQILVATTVIEVGVDVPAATVMVIEQAERFGLTQLHQLRGRVGRGGNESYCILMYASESEQQPSEMARRRLRLLRDCEDGFRIAEADMEWRGAGELMGTRQSGPVEFMYFDFLRHRDLVDAIMLNVQAKPLIDTTDPTLQFLLRLFNHAQVLDDISGV